MTISRLFKVFSFSIALLFIQACSHPIEIVGEGDVTSASGTRGCSLEDFQTAQDKCTKNYALGAYQETYYATPRAGWQFDHWGNNYCQDAPPPNYDCSFNIDAGVVQQFWGLTVPPLQAVFTSVSNGTPISGDDIVTVNGREWAQPDLFTNLNRNQISAVCPGGACSNGGVLDGHDMTGWTWASDVNVRELFNRYIGKPILTEQLERYQMRPDDDTGIYFQEDFRWTYFDGYVLGQICGEVSNYATEIAEVDNNWRIRIDGAWIGDRDPLELSIEFNNVDPVTVALDGSLLSAGEKIGYIDDFGFIIMTGLQSCAWGLYYDYGVTFDTNYVRGQTPKVMGAWFYRD